MIKKLSIQVFIGLMTFSSIELFNSRISVAIPLRAGFYYGGGSRYIEIHQQGDRICYRGFSPNGSLITSVEADPNYEDIYILNHINLSVVQKDENTLLFGAFSQGLLEYTLESNLDSFDAENSQIQQCLNTTTPYYNMDSSLK